MPMLECGCWDGAWWGVDPPPTCSYHREVQPVVQTPDITPEQLERLRQLLGGASSMRLTPREHHQRWSIFTLLWPTVAWAAIVGRE